MKSLTLKPLLGAIFLLLFGCENEPPFVNHEDLPDNMMRVYLYVRDADTKDQISGAEIKFLTPKGLAMFEATSKPDKPWDFMGTRTPSIDFQIHGKTVEVTKEGYESFSSPYEDLPSVEQASNSFDVYVDLQKTK